jgi:hypothetical protein
MLGPVIGVQNSEQFLRTFGCLPWWAKRDAYGRGLAKQQEDSLMRAPSAFSPAFHYLL